METPLSLQGGEATLPGEEGIKTSEPDEADGLVEIRPFTDRMPEKGGE